MAFVSANMPDIVINPLDEYRFTPPTPADTKRLATEERHLTQLRTQLGTYSPAAPEYAATEHAVRTTEMKIKHIHYRIEKAYSDVPTYLRMARLVAGLTRRQLSTLSFISETVISRRERGLGSTLNNADIATARTLVSACAYYIAHAPTRGPILDDGIYAPLNQVFATKPEINGIPFPTVSLPYVAPDLTRD